MHSQKYKTDHFRKYLNKIYQFIDYNEGIIIDRNQNYSRLYNEDVFDQEFSNMNKKIDTEYYNLSNINKEFHSDHQLMIKEYEKKSVNLLKCEVFCDKYNIQLYSLINVLKKMKMFKEYNSEKFKSKVINRTMNKKYCTFYNLRNCKINIINIQMKFQ